MFGIGETEFVIILVFGFMLFGPDKLPGMGRTIGRALRQFREAQEGFTEVVQSEVMDPLNKAMSEPLSGDTRRRAAEKSAAFDEDSDLDGDGVHRERTTETFAERRSRLERERKEREARKDEGSAKASGASAVGGGATGAGPDAEAVADPGRSCQHGRPRRHRRRRPCSRCGHRALVPRDRQGGQARHQRRRPLRHAAGPRGGRGGPCGPESR